MKLQRNLSSFIPIRIHIRRFSQIAEELQFLYMYTFTYSFGKLLRGICNVDLELPPKRGVSSHCATAKEAPVGMTIKNTERWHQVIQPRIGFGGRNQMPLTVL